MSQGETVPEALTNLIDAVQGVIAARMEEYFETLPSEQSESPRALSVAF
jgi:predicted RNase H-like HicB family nuclease